MEKRALDEVGQRLTGGTAIEQCVEACRLCFGQFALGMSDQIGMADATHMFQQQAGIKTVDALAGASPSRANRLARGHCSESASAASCSAWCSVASAPTISSRSPSMIESILYSVRLMRWSVTRPCGKL